MFNSYQQTTLQYDKAKCVGCGKCSTVCPHRVFTQYGNKAELIDASACMECGACQLNCPAGAISVDSGVGCAGGMIRAALRGEKLDKANCTCG
ncbi:MAG: mercury methylation ferredoxin HgcB [Candidatus Bathyarchaeia archaeon]|jgi:NAD-dependent dihydropyrimidine dehydrogenase PreA subunit